MSRPHTSSPHLPSAPNATRDKPRARLPRAERRTQLLEVARAAFAKRGYDGVSLEMIAAAAGVSRPVLYNHFGDKQGLFEAVLEVEIARVQVTVGRAIFAPGDYRQRLERGLSAFFSYAEIHPDGHAVLTRDGPLHLSGERFDKMLTGLADQITRVITASLEAENMDPTPAPLYASALIGVGTHVGRWWLGHSEMSVEDVTRYSTGLIWDGFDSLIRTANEAAALAARTPDKTEAAGDPAPSASPIPDIDRRPSEK